MKDKSASPLSDSGRDRFIGHYIACGLIMILILIVDLSIPLGVAMGVAYIVVVFISLWSPQNKFTISVTIGCTLLIIGAFLYKPDVHEMWKVIINRILSLFAIWVTAILGLQRKRIGQKHEAALREREKALDEVKKLQGLLPICSSCKKIRDKQGNWTQIEIYVRNHSEADFSHGICPECAQKLYPEFHKSS